MVGDAEKIITMGCEAKEFCPARFLPKVEDWKIEDPMGKSLDGIRSIRGAIYERVERLLEALQSN
jgi:protein-tyrosine-phosphatase